MACSDTADVNVFLSRVGFNDHLPSQPAATSLLTFADMVLALDNRTVCGETVSDSIRTEKNSQDDHTYASNKSHKNKMTTRSQALKINQCQSQMLHNKHRHLELSDVRNDRTGECLSNFEQGEVCEPSGAASPSQGNCHLSCIYTSATPAMPNKSFQEMDKRVKRSSSVENITSESIAIDSFSEWPEITRKYSPRKSCSFEEVNKNTIAQKSEDRRKVGSSGQLHRLVNDTLEFPCWPRKADHTYATATWDGTAASHSLFEQELNQEDMKTEDSEIMEVTETFIVPLRKLNSNSFFDDQQKNDYVLQNHTYQKDDHTYVKQNSNYSVNNFSHFHSDSIKKSGYSCSTFPRQKCREDHTYFSSGLSKHGSGSSGKDWNSVHTVTNLSQSKERESTVVKSVPPQLFSAKKDHNYSTSA